MLTLPQRTEPQDQGVDGPDPLLPMSLGGMLLLSVGF